MLQSHEKLMDIQSIVCRQLALHSFLTDASIPELQLRGQHGEERWTALLERQRQYRDRLSHQIQDKVGTQTVCLMQI